MSLNVLISLVSLLLLLLWWRCCAADLCNWSGSGLSPSPGEEEDSRTVLQVRLRCAEGWVEWSYPGTGVHQALRVVLEPPNLSYLHPHGGTACLKPFFHGGVRGGGAGAGGGASVYIERSGELELLTTDGDDGGGLRPQQVFCYRADYEGPHRPAIYLQASPPVQSEVSRRVVGFRYELLRSNSSSPPASHLLGGGGLLDTACRPCTDAELLLAICNSDFVVRGYIKSISHDRRQQTSLVEVSGGRVYRQRSGAFEREEGGGGEEEVPFAAGSRASRPEPGPAPGPAASSSWHGRVRTPLQCGVRPGGGHFLFTGSEHFGEAWLGCAPRYKHFLSLYRTSRAAGRTSCDFPLD